MTKAKDALMQCRTGADTTSAAPIPVRELIRQYQMENDGSSHNACDSSGRHRKLQGKQKARRLQVPVCSK